jgi:hypothetical protein
VELESCGTHAVQDTRPTGLEGKRPHPDKMLRELPSEILEKAGADIDYIRRYDDVMDVFRNYMQQKE